VLANTNLLVDYRFGFNGQEKDNEIKGIGNSLSYKFRMQDVRLGRFFAVDPLTKKYPWYTPYQVAGNTPIKYVELEGLEPANNPKDATKQDGRNPTGVINTIYKESGGEDNYKNNFSRYSKGTYSSSTSITGSGISNKEGYTSDSKTGAEKGNLWVNSNGALLAEDMKSFDSRDFSNFLLGNMINGQGPENIIYPVNGTVSNYMKGAGIVGDAMNSWYALNKGRDNLVGGIAEFSGDNYMPGAFMSKGMFHPESFVGSATVMITPINSTQVMVQVFNVTSLTSGDLLKDWPGNNPSTSVVRDPNAPKSSNRYGNMSQTYQFTMPINSGRLK